MRVSLHWIERLLDVDSLGLEPGELVERLSTRVAEIDGFERTGASLDGVVVGLVLTAEPHPDADRLRCCTVDLGDGAVTPIVCGAPNVAAGQKVAVASVGTTLQLPGKDGALQPVTIKAARLRGQPSQGMICAEDELGLGDGHDGILVLDRHLPPGMPLAEALGRDDVVLEIDNHNINHRPDLWGHLGWAREIAAVLDLPFHSPYDPAWHDQGSGFTVSIEDPAGCRGYCGALVTGVSNQPSPVWMQRLLEAAGARPRGLLVDLTNYVMLELGQPMHAFDARALAGERLIVRRAQANETITTLDGKTHELAPEALLIADQSRALALAGIMGGEGSMVHDDTDTIVLESATFDPVTIRRTRLALGVATDSSARFEKQLYPEMAAAGINRALGLLAECCPEMAVACRFHAGTTAAPGTTLAFDPNAFGRLAGLELAAESQIALLARLGIEIDGNQASVPWWRAKDVTETVDLVEEIGRLHGYDHLVRSVPRLPATVPTANPERRSEHTVRNALSAAGWDEVATYVFTAEAWVERLGQGETAIAVDNPPSAQHSHLRPSLLPNLLEAIGGNRRYLDAVSIYEVGRVYGCGAGRRDGWDERGMLAGACAAAGEETPFYAARDAALAALAALGHSATVAPSAGGPEWAIPGRRAAIRVGEQVVGVVGEVVPAFTEAARCQEATACFELEWEQIVHELAPPPPHPYAPPSNFQAVKREFTWLCPEALPYADVAATMARAVGNLAIATDLVSLYRGEGVPDGHKALSLSLRLQAADRSLSDQELSKLSDKVVRTVEQTTTARLRR